MTFVNYVDGNWALLLLVAALIIMIKTTVHLTKKDALDMMIVASLVLLLSVVDYIETGLGAGETYTFWRTALSGIKYAIPPFILAEAIRIYNRTGNMLAIFAPATINAIICAISLFNKVIFYIDSNNNFHRGMFGYLPFIVCGIYLLYIVVRMIITGNRSLEDLVPVIFLALTSAFSIVLPIIIGTNFNKWFCTTVAINVFVYYIFIIQQYTKKDPLTGLLNRQSYYSDMEKSGDSITAAVSLDMNGLKTLNDTKGHAAGDEALVELAGCFAHAARLGQRVYRVGGDEFMILCWRTSEPDLKKLVTQIRRNVISSDYSCSVGLCYRGEKMSVEELIRISDERMYVEKERYYGSLEGLAKT